MLSNRKWIADTLAYQPHESVPYNFDFSPPARKLVEAHFGSPVEEVLNLPLRMTSPKSIKPLYAAPKIYGDRARDEFGVVWSTNEIDRGSPIVPCLPEADLVGYEFPEAAASYRFEEIGRWSEEQCGHFRVIWVGDLWERATFMRGMESILFDLALNPLFVDRLLRGLSDYVLKTMEILFERFDFEAIALSDDYGSQRALLMSPAQWRRFVKPLLSEIYAFAKKHKYVVFHHSCGNIWEIIPDMIDIGLDVLHPIQPEAMNPVELKREFGKELTLCGGLRTQDLLPRGTAGEVRDEVRRLKEQLGRGGGYILEPGITLQADVPADNLVAMIEEAMKD
jgi:uroporphyrinogen decarboxylase